MATFKAEFTLLDKVHTRMARMPAAKLTHGVKKVLDLPEVGRTHMDYYESGHLLYARLYAVESGQFAWYAVQL